MYKCIAPMNPIIIGKIGAAQGILGWLKLFSFTEKYTSVFDYTPWVIKKNNIWFQIEIEKKRKYKTYAVVKLKNIDNRNLASKLTSHVIITEYSRLPVLALKDYYRQDILGCQVTNMEGYIVGQVTDILETGSNDVMIVQSRNKERLIPFIDQQVIKNVDIHKKKIEVDWNFDL